MNFRSKLLISSALPVVVSVVVVAVTVAAAVRHSVERNENERTQALWTQFRHAFDHQGEQVAAKADAITSSEPFASLAARLARNPSDSSRYFDLARTVADGHQLDFLEFIDSHGVIISSAQSPAMFGYAEPAFAADSKLPAQPFLKQEVSSGGIAALGLFAWRSTHVDAAAIYVLAGRRLDKEFFASFDLPAGMRAFLYRSHGSDSTANLLIDSNGRTANDAVERLSPLIHAVQETREEMTAVVHWSSDAADDEAFHAFPLIGTGPQPDLLGMVMIGTTRRSYVDLERRIRNLSILLGAVVLVVALVFSSWVAARVTKPVEELSTAATLVAEGNWNAQVEQHGNDELAALAGSFNHMTAELRAQRDRLVQTERVAAWRELARRLAHELKNPLFPLQITVDNLVRAKESVPAEFDDIFRESTAALRAEIANLTAIVGRFSDFSRMPQPQLERVPINDVVQQAVQIVRPQLARQQIQVKMELGHSLQQIQADPELLHRVLSNLILNALDAMPNGGTLTLRTRDSDHDVFIEVADTGSGLTQEEISRIFTPYYTSKQHGTGLGLAIVQSVVSDHGGTISVSSTAGSGATFTISLPKSGASDKTDEPS